MMKRSIDEELFEDEDDNITKLNSYKIKKNDLVINKPACQYGISCYRKNPQHFEEYLHPDEILNAPKISQDLDIRIDSPHNLSKSSSSLSSPSSSSDIFSSSKSIDRILLEDTKVDHFNPLMFLTNVSGIDDDFNQMAIDIKDILSTSLGSLIKSCQFNYCIDIPWLVKQYPLENRSKPLLIVHGSNQEEKKCLENEAKNFSHIRLCNAPLEIPFGTHHTKMMFLLYKEGLRVVISTANLRIEDWYQKTQGVWVSPIFKKLTDASAGDSKTNFKSDLIQYLKFYKRHELNEWIEIVKEHDMFSARVFLIASVPGRHSGPTKNMFGHLKIKEVLRKHNSCSILTDKWPLIAQFSSVGSLGATSSAWLTGEFLNSLSCMKSNNNATQCYNICANPPLHLIFPSVENVRSSLEGYAAGRSIPYSLATSQKQLYFSQNLNQWVSNKSGRSLAAPHIKTYMRLSPCANNIAWFLLTSSNLSKAAWGYLEKKDSQLMIRSYELGVLFIPNIFCDDWDYFAVQDFKLENYFHLPIDVPLTPYTKDDRPWIWDINYNQPDSNGNIYSKPD